MELHRRPSSSTGFHSERVSSPICRRADSFADLDTLHHRAPAVFAPKPLKPRRTFSSMATHNTTFAPVLSAPTSSVASPTAGIAMRRMLSVDDEHFMAYEELHDILFSSGESDLESSSSDGGLVLSRSSYSPASSTASPIEIGRSSARANEAFFQGMLRDRDL